MFGQNFYNSCIRNYIVAFGSLFNDILINRYDATGHISQVIKVPLTHAVKNKMMALVQANPAAGETDGTQRQVGIQLPIISFYMTDLAYNQGRKLNTLNTRWAKDDENADAGRMQYMPVPVDLHFEVNILSNLAEDGAKIVEQIVPYFKPQWDMTVHVMPELGITLDIPVIWSGSFTQNPSFNSDFTQQQAIVWTANFTMKAQIFGPVKTKPIIKFPREDFYFGEGVSNGEYIGSIQVTPGLTANGQPTSNVAETVNAHTIFVDDNWDLIVTANGIVSDDTA